MRIEQAKTLEEHDDVKVVLIPTCPSDQETLSDLAMRKEIAYNPDDNLLRNIVEVTGLEEPIMTIHIYGGDLVRDTRRGKIWRDFCVAVPRKKTEPQYL